MKPKRVALKVSVAYGRVAFLVETSARLQLLRSVLLEIWPGGI